MQKTVQPLNHISKNIADLHCSQLNGQITTKQRNDRQGEAQYGTTGEIWKNFRDTKKRSSPKRHKPSTQKFGNLT